MLVYGKMNPNLGSQDLNPNTGANPNPGKVPLGNPSGGMLMGPNHPFFTGADSGIKPKFDPFCPVDVKNPNHPRVQHPDLVKPEFDDSLFPK